MRPSDARQLLAAERERLVRVKTSLEHDGLSEQSQRRSTGELSGSDEHLADVASETEIREEELSLLSTVDAELVAVETALARVDDGAYGRCERCGRLIGDERLVAMPAARYCIEDQQVAERHYAVTADHGCDRLVEVEAFAHLDLLPQDDDVVTLAVEELAVTHSRPPRTPAQGLA